MTAAEYFYMALGVAVAMFGLWLPHKLHQRKLIKKLAMELNVDVATVRKAIKRIRQNRWDEN